MTGAGRFSVILTQPFGYGKARNPLPSSKNATDRGCPAPHNASLHTPDGAGKSITGHLADVRFSNGQGPLMTDKNPTPPP